MANPVPLLMSDDALGSQWGEVVTGTCVGLTDPQVWKTIRDLIPMSAEDMIFVHSLDASELRRVADACTVSSPAMIVGFGGGQVLDATKYVAAQLQVPYVLCPTSSASNAAFTRFTAVHDGSSTVGRRISADPVAIVIDRRVINRAPDFVNRAGAGDALALLTLERDWQYAQQHGSAKEDPVVRRHIQTLFRRFVTGMDILFHSGEAPYLLFSVFAEHGALVERNPDLPLGAGSEHLFAWTLNTVVGREILHGGAVALGFLLMDSWHEHKPSPWEPRLERWGIPWHPERNLGVTWTDVEGALRAMAAYNVRHRRFITILDARPLDSEAVADLIGLCRETWS